MEMFEIQKNSSLKCESDENFGTNNDNHQTNSSIATYNVTLLLLNKTFKLNYTIRMGNISKQIILKAQFNKKHW